MGFGVPEITCEEQFFPQELQQRRLHII